MIESAEEFVRLRASGEAADFQRIKQEEASLEVWLAIVRDRPDMRFWVAFNRTLPVEVLEVLAGDGDWRVRDKVASKRDTPAGVLEVLSGDQHEAVLSTVAGNPGTPTRALEALSRHSWDQIREKALKQLRDRREA
ncbi:hypothetical protein [Kitasatospora sp. KL5]|uniref:hypothetical protein n=1 Tax=Kitasatospora sp. KL5 TaxID=3425125 RepID=UPI003D6F5CB1